MDSSLFEDQQLMVDALIEFVRLRNRDTYFHECDKKHEYLFEWAETICELGFDCILLPEEYDGLGADWVTLTAAYEALGREGGPTYTPYQLSCWDTVLREGTEEQKEKILSFVGADKQMLNYVTTELSVGSSRDDIRTIYTREDGKAYLNSHKTFITSFLYAPYLVVMARDSENMDTYAEWFVDMSLPGITKESLVKLGLHMDSCCDVYLDNVELEEKDLFGKEGNGSRRGVADFDLERLLVTLTDYGIAYCASEDAVKYADQRIQGGQAIIHHQLIRLKFAEMKVRLTNMRSMLYEIVWKHDNGQLLRGDCLTVKYYCSEVSFKVIDRAPQVLVGVDITGDYRIQCFCCDPRMDCVSSGTDEMMILTTDRSTLYPYR